MLLNLTPPPWQPVICFPSIYSFMCNLQTCVRREVFNLLQRQSRLTGSFSMSMGLTDLILNKFTDTFDTVKYF